MRCRAHGCENDSKDGMFLGEICVPCYEALGTPDGVTYPGTSILFTWPNRIRDLEAALRWTATELMKADAWTEDDISVAPEAIHATIVSVMTPAETKGESNV